MDSLKLPQVIPLSPGARGWPRSALLVRDSDGELRAYLNECKHLPVPLDSGSGAFVSKDGLYLLCNTHGALYRFDDGYCVSGPCAGSSLTRLSLKVDDGVCWIEDHR